MIDVAKVADLVSIELKVHVYHVITMQLFPFQVNMLKTLGGHRSLDVWCIINPLYF